MYVVPNTPGKLGRWERHGRIAGDYVFIEETVRLQGEPVFVEEVTVLMRPERNRSSARGCAPATGSRSGRGCKPCADGGLLDASPLAMRELPIGFSRQLS